MEKCYVPALSFILDSTISVRCWRLLLSIGEGMSLFHVGQVVKLRSGWHPMTVTEAEVLVDGRTHVRCRWLYGGQQADEVFPENCLTVEDAGVHRHLIGVESPPEGYVLDNMTIGPNFPRDWEVETWVLRGVRRALLASSLEQGDRTIRNCNIAYLYGGCDILREDVSGGGSRKAELD